MESSNAWERAQRAIARASERDEHVVTPDTAISPFDASHTTVIPWAEVHGRGVDPDVTQRLPHHSPVNGTSSHGNHARPETSTDAAPRPDAPTRVPHPGTSPLPVSEPDEAPAAPPKRSWWKRLLRRP